MMQLRVVQAKFGDCFLLENGSGRRRKYILVDGGPSGVYQPYLRPELAHIAANGGRLERLVLSHVDNDHILGLLELMDELRNARKTNQPPLIEIAGMWHNTFRAIAGAQAQDPEIAQRADTMETLVMSAPLEETATAVQTAVVTGSVEDAPTEDTWLQAMPEFGIQEGHNLLLADQDMGIPLNQGFPNGLVTREDSPHAVTIGGMRLWVIGPPQKNLETLRKVWQRWLQKEGLPFDLQTVKPDDSETNLSSIMLLAENSSRKILLTGDGLGDDVVSGLEAAGKLVPGGTLHVDILKLPHHGSARNCVGSLFERVLADIYVVSANGKYGNPDLQTLEWLVDAACRQGRDIQIFSTNDTDGLRTIQKTHPPEQNHYQVTILPAGTTSVLL